MLLIIHYFIDFIGILFCLNLICLLEDFALLKASDPALCPHLLLIFPEFLEETSGFFPLLISQDLGFFSELSAFICVFLNY